MGPCALALAASAVLGLPLDAPSVAVWVQSSGGMAGLASTLEDALRADARVLTSADVSETMGWIAPSELRVSDLARIRGDLEVGRLLVVVAGRRSGTLTVHLRERDRSASYVLVVEAGTAREAVEDLLAWLPPLPIAHVRIDDAGIERPPLQVAPRIRYPRRNASAELDVYVDRTGRVVRVQYVSGDDLLGLGAVRDLARSRYAPLVVDGAPIAWVARTRLASPVRALCAKGDVDVSVTSAISAGSSTLRLGGEDTHDDSRSGSLQGTAGYFAADHVEVFATGMFKVPMEHTAIYGRTIAAGGGGAYLVPVGGDGGWHAGPAVWVGYEARSGEIRGPSGGTSFEGEGLTAFAGLLARIAFNDRVAVAMSVGGYVESYSVNASGSSNEAGYGTDTGIRIGVTLGSR